MHTKRRRLECVLPASAPLSQPTPTLLLTLQSHVLVDEFVETLVALAVALNIGWIVEGVYLLPQLAYLT